MKYKEFILDSFQEEAINYIEKNKSVIVSAATGTGKTLIADYVIDKCLKSGRKAVYTAPIKALSNQKFRDFKKDYGEDKIGIMTGDVVINPTAPIIIMTTEIYRNMLLTGDRIINTIDYVIFDEIHFINDIERGTVWEESIIFSPEHIRFLALSATIPNADEFADWIMSIKKHEVKVVCYNKRAVPLEHFLYDIEFGISTANALKKKLITSNIPEYYETRGRRRKRKPREPSQISLIRELKNKDLLPCFFFVFSRLMCERKAMALSRKFDFTDNKQKAEIVRIAKSMIDPEIAGLESVQKVRYLLSKGIGVHHAGLLPSIKVLVEVLFSKGLISVLYTTETFAVGINMPARTVVFNTLQKYDGVSFRYLNTKEYFQLAGRAGRRGIDKKGTAIAMYHRQDHDIDKIIKLTSKDVEPITSRFSLSFNTVINLIRAYGDEEIEKILKSNFDYYLKLKNNKPINIMARFNNMVKLLDRMGYIVNGKLTHKGVFAGRIYTEEILVAEIFYGEAYKSLTDVEINIICGAIIYEPSPNDRFKMEFSKDEFLSLWNSVNINSYVKKNLNRNNIKKMFTIIKKWTEGCSFDELLSITNLLEGDIIRLFRQIIDLLRQIRHASEEDALKHRVSECIEKIDRDIIQVRF